jgi:hypothetical protein
MPVAVCVEVLVMVAVFVAVLVGVFVSVFVAVWVLLAWAVPVVEITVLVLVTVGVEV